MARRRRRRDRQKTGEQRAPAVDRRAARPDERRRETFEAKQLSLRRRRTIIGALGFVPLGGALGCGAGVEFLCLMPREGWLAIWAALFGSFIGITIRLFLERRKFQREATGG